MRVLLVLAAVLALALPVLADLRMASQPRNNYQVKQRAPKVPFLASSALYMEPSAFNYAGLIEQRKDAYDNFLRSNIDNEQAKRNFNTEAGRDMLPFRSYEGATSTADTTVETKIPAGPPGPTITAAPGVPYEIPLRWNNPHSSELEVNIWLFKTTSTTPIVIPIRKPSCSGEGHQDNVISFTIPSDFNNLGSIVPGFTGCKAVGDCVLQVYAHSVESRMYAIGTPLIVNGTVTTATATNTNGVYPATKDVGVTLSALSMDTCLSSASTNPSPDIATSVPRFARLISDEFNSAYQNSQFSPYSGQQPEAISKNLQASAILKMVSADRGELGQNLLAKNQTVYNFQQYLYNRVESLYKKYESIAEDIIETIGDQMKDTGNLTAIPAQRLANCFRCVEVGAVTPTRLTTTTYIPSFQITDAGLWSTAQTLVAARYSGLLVNAPNGAPGGLVQIYVATLNDLNAQFVKAASYGLYYLDPLIKTTMTTFPDATNYTKVNAAGKKDRGIYAATQAAIVAKAMGHNGIPVTVPTPPTQMTSALESPGALPATNTVDITPANDMFGVDGDTACDNDAVDTSALNCTALELAASQNPLFVLNPSDPDAGMVSRMAAANMTTGNGTATNLPGAASTQSVSVATIAVTVVAAVVAAVFNL